MMKEMRSTECFSFKEKLLLFHIPFSYHVIVPLSLTLPLFLTRVFLKCLLSMFEHGVLTLIHAQLVHIVLVIYIMLASCLNRAPTRSFSHTRPITSSTRPLIVPHTLLMCLCHLLPYLANMCRWRYISIKMHCVTLQRPSLALALLLRDSLITHTSPFHYSR